MKCITCGKLNEHYHIRFTDGSKVYRECKECYTHYSCVKEKRLKE